LNDLASYDTLNKLYDLHYVLFYSTLQKLLKHLRILSFTYPNWKPNDHTVDNEEEIGVEGDDGEKKEGTLKDGEGGEDGDGKDAEL